MTNETSDRLKRLSAKIMQIWEERTLREVAAAKYQKSLALRDSLPQYLSQMVAALSTTVNRTDARKKWDKSESLRVGQEHGRDRAGSTKYSIDQLIQEYRILREVICDEMEAEAILSPIEREVIVSSIEQAVSDAATEFSGTLRAIQERLMQTLAHDLRGPLSAAKTNAQLIMKRAENLDYCVKKAARISNSMDRLDSMIRDLLDASVIRAGQTLPMKLEACDLVPIVRQVVEDATEVYGNRFKIDSPETAKGYWNENALRRVLENLVNNAVKYGTPESLISLKVQNEKGRTNVSVHNQGKAIPPAERSVLFEQFRRSRTSEEKIGWGLGLTVVKGIAEAHHGKVRVDSEEGAGTTFTVELPTKPGASDEAA